MGMKIIMAVCFMPCLFLMFGFLYFEGIRKGNIQFGVTLWQEAQKDTEFLQIQKKFKKEMKWFLLICIVVFICTCIPARSSVVIGAQMIWFLFVMVIFFVPLARANKRLKVLKREKQVEEVNENQSEVRYVDIKAAAEPRKKTFLFWSVIGVILGLIPVIGEIFLAEGSFFGWWTEGFIITMFFVGILLLWILCRYAKLSTEVVSYQSEINIQLNRVNKYQWSRFFCMVIWCNSLFTFIMWYGMHRPKETFYIIFGGTILYTVIILVAAMFTWRNVRQVYEKYSVEPGSMTDGDEHWIWGLFYYNKNDNRFMVNRRTGVGTTVNMAKTSAKVLMGSIVVSLVGLIFGTTIYCVIQDFTPISLEVTEHTVVSAQYKNDYTIFVGDIVEVQLLEELPGMSKRTGTNTETLLKGSFLDENYESCEVCVRNQNPPFIKITDKNGRIYYLNDENSKDTYKTYEVLKDRLGL